MLAGCNEPVLVQIEGRMIDCNFHQNFNRLSDLLPWVDPAQRDFVLHAGFGVSISFPTIQPVCTRTPPRAATPCLPMVLPRLRLRNDAEAAA
jgi:hypothetical protein